jgi:antitoxin CcdA
MGKHDSIVGKRPANVTINARLLARAKALNINLSRTLEARLEQLVREAEGRRWLDDNRKALEAYNARIERDGLWSNRLRTF